MEFIEFIGQSAADAASVTASVNVSVLGQIVVGEMAIRIGRMVDDSRPHRLATMAEKLLVQEARRVCARYRPSAHCSQPQGAAANAAPRQQLILFEA